MNRGRKHLTKAVAAGLLLASAVLFGPWEAGADTVQPGIAYEGWFARTRPENPTVPVPCLPPPAPNPVGCGPVNPAPVPTPQSVATGAYVVASAGGEWGRSESSGDTAWAAYQWDLFSFLDVTVNRFTVTLSHAPDNRGDFGTPVLQGCNIVTPWAAEPGSNPWENRPLQDCSQPVKPTVKDGKYTFEVARYAQTWVDGTGYGLIIVPGEPGTETVAPFQHTFAGYYSTAANAAEVVPVVHMDFTPAIDDGFGSGGFGGSTDGGGFFEETTTFGGDSGGFAPSPDIDIDPNDVGSEPPTESGDTDVESASPPLRRAATDTGFPLSALMLLPLAALAFWGVGTALGPAGDPVSTRKGGVSRMLEQRRADSPTRTRST